MAPFEALYGRICWSPIGWFGQCVESSLLGTESIYKALEKVHIVRNVLKTSYSWHKSDDGNKRRDTQFQEGDMIYLKISPMKGVVRFHKKGKFIPR